MRVWTSCINTIKTVFYIQGLQRTDGVYGAFIVLDKKMTQRIKISSGDAHADPDNVEHSEYAEYFPGLIVVVRDFFLNIEKDGKI